MHALNVIYVALLCLGAVKAATVEAETLTHQPLAGNENTPKIVAEAIKKKITYDGDQVFRVFPVNSKHLKKVKEMEFNGLAQRWGTKITSIDLHVKKEKIEEMKNTLKKISMDYQVIIDDVQRLVDDENPPITSEELKEFASRNGHNMTFDRYHRTADIYGYLDYLANIKPTIVSVITINQSAEGRPIKVIKISSGHPNASAFWIDAGTHAREWISVATASYIIYELVENRENLDQELQAIDFYILPILNPDGYEYSHEHERLWRKNRRPNSNDDCIGTDLNRNWGYEWGKEGSSQHPCSNTYGGTGPLSEPETRAVADFILERACKFKAFVTFHSYGQYIFYPWGYDTNPPANVEDLDRVGRIAAAAMKKSGGEAYTVGNSAALIYLASGGSFDWTLGVANIKYSYAIELRNKRSFNLPAKYIKISGKEAFAAITAIAKEVF